MTPYAETLPPALALNLRELLCGLPVRLRYTIRFSTCRVAHKESVAEHSYYVALYAHAVALWILPQRNGPQINMGVILEKALIHDLEESITGDVPRTFKYSSTATKAALDAGAKTVFGRVSGAIFGETNTARYYNWIWANSKDLSKEGRIVAFADFLSVLSYLLQERIDHNELILEHCSAMADHFKVYADASFDFIRPLVDEAGRLMQSLFDGR